MLTLNPQQRALVQANLMTENTEQKTPPKFEPKVGDTIPGTMTIDVMPLQLVRTEPSLEPYGYAKLAKDVLVIDPMNKKIVAVLPRAEPSSGKDVAPADWAAKQGRELTGQAPLPASSDKAAEPAGDSGDKANGAEFDEQGEVGPSIPLPLWERVPSQRVRAKRGPVMNSARIALRDRSVRSTFSHKGRRKRVCRRSRAPQALNRLLGRSVRLDPRNPRELLTNRTLRRLDVIAVLQIEPDLRRGAERLAQAQCGVGGDARGLGGDALDAGARYTHGLGQRARGEVERSKKLLAQNFAGMEGRKPLGHGGIPFNGNR